MASASQCCGIPATDVWGKRRRFPWGKSATLLSSFSGNSFDCERHTLPDADAHGGKPELAAVFFKAMRRGQRQPRTRHAERMTECDRAAMRVDLRRVVGKPELAQYGKRLRCKSLVKLDHGIVGNLVAEPRHQLLGRGHRADA